LPEIEPLRAELEEVPGKETVDFQIASLDLDQLVEIKGSGPVEAVDLGQAMRPMGRQNNLLAWWLRVSNYLHKRMVSPCRKTSFGMRLARQNASLNLERKKQSRHGPCHGTRTILKSKEHPQ